MRKIDSLSLPIPARVDMVIEAIDLLETFAKHAASVARRYYMYEGATLSWYIQGADDLKEKVERAGELSLIVRNYMWDFDVSQSVKSIKRLDDSENFISMYLNPDAKTTTEDEQQFIEDYIKGNACLDRWDNVEQHIKSMSYKDFLKTPYWKFISSFVKSYAGRCACCGSNKNLEVHHPTYEFHGSELQNLKRLTVLCHDCHKKFHESHKSEGDSISELLKKAMSTAKVNKTNEE